MAKAKQKYYVVWRGKQPGIYTTWADCEAQVKGAQASLYKAFDTQQEAEAAFAGNPYDYIGQRRDSAVQPSDNAAGGPSGGPAGRPSGCPPKGPAGCPPPPPIMALAASRISLPAFLPAATRSEEYISRS